MQTTHHPPDDGSGQRGPWPSDWLRAALGLCALRALEAGPSYGYAIIAELERAGLGAVKGGTLYPLLTRFESAGLVQTRWEAGDGGPGRKYFALTDAGRAELEAQRVRWAGFATTTTTYLDPARDGNDDGRTP